MSLTPSPQMNSEQSSKSTPQHCVEESLRKDQMTKPAVGAASVYSHESLHLLCHCWDCLPRCSQNSCMGITLSCSSLILSAQQWASTYAL